MSTASALFASTSPTKLKSSAALPSLPADAQTVSGDVGAGLADGYAEASGFEGRDAQYDHDGRVVGLGNERGNQIIDGRERGSEFTSMTREEVSVPMNGEPSHDTQQGSEGARASIAPGSRSATAPGAATAAILAKARAVTANTRTMPDRRTSGSSSAARAIDQATTTVSPVRPLPGRSFGSSSSGAASSTSAAPATSPPSAGRSGTLHTSQGGGGGSASFFGAVASPPRPSSAQSAQGSLTSLSPPVDAREPQSPGSGAYATPASVLGTGTNGAGGAINAGSRFFGERDRGTRSPPGSIPSGSSPSTHPSFPFKPPTTRQRSGSSLSITSTTSLDQLQSQVRSGINLNAIQNNLQTLATGAVGAVGAVGQADREAFFAAADKATTWLSGWAPKGEGRSREFLKGTWSGIGNVAGAVGGAVGEIGRGGRFGEGFGAGQGGGGGGGEGRPGSPEVVANAGNGNGNGNGSEDAVAGAGVGAGGRVFGGPGEGMARTASTGGRVFGASPSAGPVAAPAVGQVGGRRILQPANLRRLGRSSSIDTGPKGPDEAVHAPPLTHAKTDQASTDPSSVNVPTSSLSLSTSNIPRVMSTSPTPTSSRPSNPFPASSEHGLSSGSAPQTQTSSHLQHAHAHAQPALHVRRSSAQAAPSGHGKMPSPLGRPRAQSRPGMPPSASTSALAPRVYAGDNAGAQANNAHNGNNGHQGSPNALSLSASPGSGQYLAMAASASTGPHGSSHLNPNAAAAITANGGHAGVIGDQGGAGAGAGEGGGATRGTGRYRHGHSNSYSGIPGAGGQGGLGLPSGAAGQRRAPSFGAVPSLSGSALAAVGHGASQGLMAPGMSATSSASAASDSSRNAPSQPGAHAVVGGPAAAALNGYKGSRSGSTSLTASARPSYHHPRASNSSAYSAGGPVSPAFGATSTTPIALPRATTSTSISALASNVAATPYKVGFQPAGVKSDRSEEFARARKAMGEAREREEGRLGRRWAKLVDLHFNPNTQMPTMRRSDSSSSIDSSSTAPASTPAFGRSVSGTASPSRANPNPNSSPGTRPAPVPLPRSSSARRSLMSMENLSLRPNAVWKGLKAAAATPQQAEESRKRVEEQGIVKWEEDGSAKRCRICQAVFSLSNRKHHCRLCGRLVCSLPPTNPALLAVQMQLFPPAQPQSDTDASSTSAASASAPGLGGLNDSQSGPSANTDDAALPAGTRREKCSILLVADYKTGRGEEVEEGFVGWMKLDEQGQGQGQGQGATAAGGGEARGARGGHGRTLSRASSIAGSDSTRNTANTGLGRIRQDEVDLQDGRVPSGQVTPTKQEKQEKQEKPLPQQPREVQVKGVRVCRECWGVVSRKQKMQDRQRVSGFARLYAALRTMQAEIEEVMLEFEGHMDLLTSHHTPPDPPPALLRVHKRLLVLFAQFEALSKRVRSIPSKEGGSQAIVQAAVARSAAVFLAKEMAKVQALPRLQKMLAAEKRKSIGMRVVESSLSDLDEGERGVGEGLGKGKEKGKKREGAGGERRERGMGERELAEMLQPLLEQEAQLEQYISDANAQRKYDDGRALTEALNEIKAEIGRVMAAAV